MQIIYKTFFSSTINNLCHLTCQNTYMSKLFDQLFTGKISASRIIYLRGKKNNPTISIYLHLKGFRSPTNLCNIFIQIQMNTNPEKLKTQNHHNIQFYINKRGAMLYDRCDHIHELLLVCFCCRMAPITIFILKYSTKLQKQIILNAITETLQYYMATMEA